MWHYARPDELFHWKYLRRERVNGKWRYYYENDGKKTSIGRVTKEKLDPQIRTKEKYGVVTTSKDGGIKTEMVNRKEYRKTATGYKRFVGNTPVKELRKQNLEMGKKFIDDWITNSIHKKKK